MTSPSEAGRSPKNARPVHIRAASAADAPAIGLLIRGLTARYIASEFSGAAAARLLAAMTDDAIGGYLTAGYRYHVAESSGELAGVVAVRDNRHLYHLFVSDRFRGEGLARKLWTVAGTACLEAGNPGVFTVNSSRYAVGLYEKFGFVRQSEPTDCAGVISIPMKLELTHPMSVSTDQHWNPSQYAENARFVADLGIPVLELLSPHPGERILDLGCGDGALTRILADRGCQVLAVDASPEMVAAAAALGLDTRVVDGHRLALESEFDAVFSNAALHWMTDPEPVIDGVWRALKPGGRFVGELGGQGNVAAIVAGLEAALRARGAAIAQPWFFPAPETYRALLEKRGFTVVDIDLFPRPTPLPGDVGAWLETFAQAHLAAVPAEQRKALIAEVVDQLRPTLCNGEGQWLADYVRLRFAAVKPATF